MLVQQWMLLILVVCGQQEKLEPHEMTLYKTKKSAPANIIIKMKGGNI